MRFRRLLSIFTILFVSSVMVAAQTQTPPSTPPQKHLIMTITGFADGSDIPLKYTQAGNQTSPEITWINTPPGTVTFLLHMHDMEVSRNHTTDDQLHWLVWNIPGTATGLPEGVPAGAQLQNGAYQTSASGPVLSRSGRASQFPAAPLRL